MKAFNYFLGKKYVTNKLYFQNNYLISQDESLSKSLSFRFLKRQFYIPPLSYQDYWIGYLDLLNTEAIFICNYISKRKKKIIRREFLTRSENEIMTTLSVYEYMDSKCFFLSLPYSSFSTFHLANGFDLSNFYFSVPYATETSYKLIRDRLDYLLRTMKRELII
jgi:hypothetical protein